MTWLTRDAIDEFILSRGGLRRRTVSEYRKHLQLFEATFPEMPLDPRPIQAWLNSQGRIPHGPLQPETVHSRFRTIRAMYNQLWDWHTELEHVKNPMRRVRPPRLTPKAMRVWSDDELGRFFLLNLPKRERALLSLLTDIGPRAAECANLLWGDVADDHVILRGKTGERPAPILDSSRRLLEAIRPADAGPSDHVFRGKRGPLKYEGIYKIVRRICRTAGVDGRRSSPHTFRHTFGTRYAAADKCDIKVLQAIMGHSDLKTTMRYVQNNLVRMTRNHLACSPLRDVAGFAQLNFLHETMAVQAAEDIVRKPSARVKAPVKRRQP